MRKALLLAAALAPLAACTPRAVIPDSERERVHGQLAGAQRWLRTRLPVKIVRATAARAGGHATLFRGGGREGSVFHPLSPALLKVHKELKRVFDPRGILNPGRLYGEF